MAFDPHALLAPALEPGEQLLEVGVGAARGMRRDLFSVVAGAVVGAALVTGLAFALRQSVHLGAHGVLIVALASLVLFIVGGFVGPGARVVVGLSERRVLAAFMVGNRVALLACPREQVRVEQRRGNFMLSVPSPEGPRVIGLPSWAEPNRKLAEALQASAGPLR